MQEKDCYIKLKINDAWPFTDNGRMFTIYRNNRDYPKVCVNLQTDVR